MESVEFEALPWTAKDTGVGDLMDIALQPSAHIIGESKANIRVGDRIQFTAPDKSLGVANRDLATINAIHPDGHLSARLDNNRQIGFSAREHRHFDHGYAVTSHSSQGLTAERVLVHADTSVHPDLLNSRFA
jgi:ATP-dependent exoDNAse (exonuclease V) alpha subunit